MRDNKKCEEKLLFLLGCPIDTTVTNTIFTDITLDQMSKANATMLGAFIKIRLVQDLTDRCIIATRKGNHSDVRRGDVDKKTQDPLVLEQAHQLRLTIHIGTVPIERTNNDEALDDENILQPTCLNFSIENESFDAPDLEWYRGIICNVKSIEYNKGILLENMNLDYAMLLNIDVK